MEMITWGKCGGRRGKEKEGGRRYKERELNGFWGWLFWGSLREKIKRKCCNKGGEKS